MFTVPLPLRDRQLRLELYRTSSNTQRGRLVSMAHVSSCDMVETHTLACLLCLLLLWTCIAAVHIEVPAQQQSLKSAQGSLEHLAHLLTHPIHPI